MTYYEVLQIDVNASKEEIKSAHNKLAKMYHPDIYQGDKSFAEEKTAEINVAYNTLMDDKLRYDYDLKNNFIKPENQIKTINKEDGIVQGFYNSRLFTNIKDALKQRKNNKEIRKQERKIINEQYKIYKKNQKENKNNNNKQNMEKIKEKYYFENENKILSKLILIIICIISLLLIILCIF